MRRDLCGKVHEADPQVARRIVGQGKLLVITILLVSHLFFQLLFYIALNHLKSR